jgi:protein ImuB
MAKRFLSIWFRYLKTDWMTRRRKELANKPFVLAGPDHGRMMIRAVNPIANQQGIEVGMVVADARVIIPSLEVMDDIPALAEKIVKNLGEWCIRFTPVVAVDMPSGLILDISGCAHLWGGEEKYINTIINRLSDFGYFVKAAIADTIGAAWALAHFGKSPSIVAPAQQAGALFELPTAALRVDPAAAEKLTKLGLKKIGSFIHMPGSALRRRFGADFVKRIDQALGAQEELIEPLIPLVPFQERLPCIEPIVTAKGIEIALERLLEELCARLIKEGKGIRLAVLTCYRVDGRTQKIEIATSKASINTRHLYKLFELQIASIEPALGIELFVLDATKVEDTYAVQEKLWGKVDGLNNQKLAELIDRLTGKMGAGYIRRFLPAEHYWPERSFTPTLSLQEKLLSAWKLDRPRPLYLLQRPAIIEVTAPIPDYPPMLFRYKGKIHKIVKADGPERIEQEWWLQEGEHRDYYYVEDENGYRYWLYRLGHYQLEKKYQWFLHGLFG